MRRYFRVFVFVTIGMMIFGILGNICMPKIFPYDKLWDYRDGEGSHMDAIILGTSHPLCGILPMEMYELYGIQSCNLATSVQPIEGTYYMLQEAIRYQSLKVVIWDVSNLYIDSINGNRWKNVLDKMPVGKSKLRLAGEYLRKTENAEESICEYILPLLEHHARWKELTEQDFRLNGNHNGHFGKGGQINVTIREAVAVEDMNSIAGRMLWNNEKILYEYIDGERSESREKDVLYNTSIPDANREWAVKIKELCDENDIQLLAVKVPAVCEPQWYDSAWTSAKYDATRSFCRENGIAYYDLLYDADLDMDWERDSSDGGYHLNLYGAQKVSAKLGHYLTEHYGLTDGHNASWDRDLISYEKVRSVAFLELEQDFVTYINMLADKYHDSTIFIAASDEMTVSLTDADINALRRLGLQTDYTKAVQHSYVAVIEDGEAAYEALSNRPLEYAGVCSQSEKQYELYSSGWWTQAEASIKIGGEEHAVNSRGLNIVVYDDKRDLVLDSVAFDTWAPEHTPVRNDWRTSGYKEAFELYIMEESK